MNKEIILSAQKEIEVRFNEVDMMGVVWHGSYVAYLEDARQAFGEKYGLSYQKYIQENTFVPVVELNLHYRRPLTYGSKAVVRITYVPTRSAKLTFDYEICDPDDGTVYLTARSVQVFMDRGYRLLWYSPDFYVEWKNKMGLI